MTCKGRLIMGLNKKDLVQFLEKIATYLELKGENPFRIAAYRKAAQGLERDVRSLNEIDDFTKIPGIGKGTNDLIQEFLETGTSEILKTLEKEIPDGLIPLLKLPGLGGKRLAVLYKELDVVDADSLKRACMDGRVEKVKGFGKKTAENIVEALSNQETRPERLPVAYMLELASVIEKYLEGIPEIQRFSIAGSLRRLQETIKDLDFIIATEEAEKVREAILKMDMIQDVIASGDTKVSVTLADQYEVNVDFRLVKKDEFYTTLHHFTGSKDHNVKMRQLAKQRGEKINEYGIEVEETGEVLHVDSEKAFFNHFGIHYIPPEIREDKGEVEVFKEEVELLEHDEIRGDLHMHTTWSDGAESLEEMVNHAREKGYEYIAITDHSKFLRVANGLTESRLRKQREEIALLNEKYDDIHIFSGVEMDILPNGELDFSTEFLKEMDFVIAAIHSSFDQSEEKIMNRLYHALENPYVDLIAHPTGRIIGRRPGYKVNVEKLIERAKETNTCLELNANPQRFDLATEWLEAAQDTGVTIAINTDAHRGGTLAHMDYGVKMARKAWLKPETVLNTWKKEKLMEYINRNK